MMEIKRVNQQELMVRFSTNPGTADTREWIARIKEELTGNETMTLVDLTDLEILTSLGVNVIVGIYQSLRKQGGTIRVKMTSSKIFRVFELFQLTDLFEVRVEES